MDQDKPRGVKIVRSQYQPTKAEKEDELDFSHLEGRSVDDMADAVLPPVEIDYIRPFQEVGMAILVYNSPRLRQPTPSLGSTVPRPDGPVTDRGALGRAQIGMNPLTVCLRRGLKRLVIHSLDSSKTDNISNSYE